MKYLKQLVQRVCYAVRPSQRPTQGGLCVRCEYRARYLEEGSGPRFECGMTRMSVHSCYMYTPVIPIAYRANSGDERPTVAPWFMRARVHREKLMDAQLITVMEQGATVSFWVPTVLSLQALEDAYRNGAHRERKQRKEEKRRKYGRRRI